MPGLRHVRRGDEAEGAEGASFGRAHVQLCSPAFAFLLRAGRWSVWHVISSKSRQGIAGAMRSICTIAAAGCVLAIGGCKTDAEKDAAGCEVQAVALAGPEVYVDSNKA